MKDKWEFFVLFLKLPEITIKRVRDHELDRNLLPTSSGLDPFTPLLLSSSAPQRWAWGGGLRGCVGAQTPHGAPSTLPGAQQAWDDVSYYYPEQHERVWKTDQMYISCTEATWIYKLGAGGLFDFTDLYFLMFLPKDFSCANESYGNKQKG